MLKASRLLTSVGAQNTAPGLDNYQMFRYDNYGFNSTTQDSTGIKVLTLSTGQYLIFNSPSFSSSNDTRFSATLFNADNTIEWAKNYDIDSSNEFYLVDACLEYGNTYAYGQSYASPKLFTNTKAYICGYSNQGSASAENGWVLQINLSDGSLGWVNQIYSTSSSTYYYVRCTGIRMIGTGYVQVAINQNRWGYSGNSPFHSGYYLQYYASSGTLRYSWLYSQANQTTYTTAVADGINTSTRGLTAGMTGNHSGYPYVSPDFYFAYLFSGFGTTRYLRKFNLGSSYICIPTDIALSYPTNTAGYSYYVYGYVYSTIAIGAHHRHFVLRWDGALTTGSLAYCKFYEGENSSSYDDYNDSPIDYTTVEGGNVSGSPEPQVGKGQIVFDQTGEHFYITLTAPDSTGDLKAHIFECRTSDGEVTHQYKLSSAYDDLIAGSIDVDRYGNLIFAGSISVSTSSTSYRPFIVKLPAPRQQVITGTYNVGGSLDVTISVGSETAIDQTSSVTTSYVFPNYTTSTSTTYIGRTLHSAGTFTTNDSTTTIVSDDL